ncbi:MAG: type II secretion system protein [Candidatus Omnitrophota bacterium]
MYKQNAFTLIEIMVTVVIVGALAGLALTGYSNIMKREEARVIRQNVRAIAVAINMANARKKGPTADITGSIQDFNTVLGTTLNDSNPDHSYEYTDATSILFAYPEDSTTADYYYKVTLPDPAVECSSNFGGGDCPL